MPSLYQDFARKARERFEAKREKRRTGEYRFTAHAEYKMKQYNLSEQKVRGVIRNPKRLEEGVVKNTVAVMQPVSLKRNSDGKEVWRQEIWVMYQQKAKSVRGGGPLENMLSTKQIRIISAWRYPGVSPKRNPVPEEILRELEEWSTIEG